MNTPKDLVAPAKPSLTAAEIQAFSDRSPCNAWLGVRVLAASADGVQVELPWREEFVGSPDLRTMHGGILAAAVDVTAGLSLLAALGRPGPTIDLRIDFHRAVRSGALIGTGRVLRAGRTITCVEAVLVDAQAALVASGRGVFLTATRDDGPGSG